MPCEEHLGPECVACSLMVELVEAREALLVEFVSSWERENTDSMTRPLAFAVQRATEHHIEHHARYEALTRGANRLAEQLREALARERELRAELVALRAP